MCKHRAATREQTIRCNFKCASIRVAFQRRCVVNEAVGRSAVPGSSPRRGGRGEDTDLSHCLQGQGERSQESEQATHSDAHQTGNSAAGARALGAADRPHTRSTMHATMPIDQQVQQRHLSAAFFWLAADPKSGREISSGRHHARGYANARPAFAYLFIFGREARGGHLFSLSIAVHISGGRLAESHLPARTKKSSHTHTAAIKLVLGYCW
jgi:hypothetical protein